MMNHYETYVSAEEVESIPTAPVEFAKWEAGLKALEQEVLVPEGYELYDFGGNNVIAPCPAFKKEDGWLSTHIVGIYRQNSDKYVIFATFGIDLRRYDYQELSDAFKKAIADGREKYPDLA